MDSWQSRTPPVIPRFSRRTHSICAPRAAVLAIIPRVCELAVPEMTATPRSWSSPASTEERNANRMCTETGAESNTWSKKISAKNGAIPPGSLRPGNVLYFGNGAIAFRVLTGWRDSLEATGPVSTSVYTVTGWNREKGGPSSNAGTRSRVSSTRWLLGTPIRDPRRLCERLHLRNAIVGRSHDPRTQTPRARWGGYHPKFTNTRLRAN